MNADSIVALAVGGGLLWLGINGKADDAARLFIEDLPGFAKWGIAVFVLVWGIRQLPGEVKELAEALGIAAMVGFVLVSGPKISSEVKEVFT